MKKLLLVLSLTFLAGCPTAAETGRDLSGELVYFKDHRTDLCYAFHSVDGSPRTRVMTNVPCTDKVERLLVNK